MAFLESASILLQRLFPSPILVSNFRRRKSAVGALFFADVIAMFAAPSATYVCYFVVLAETWCTFNHALIPTSDRHKFE